MSLERRRKRRRPSGGEDEAEAPITSPSMERRRGPAAGDSSSSVTTGEEHADLYDTPVYVPTEAGTIDQYHIINRIGGGAYGDVYLAVDLITREIVAVKRVVLDIRDAGVPFNIANEMLYLDRLSHPNIIKSHRVVTSHESVFTAMTERYNNTAGTTTGSRRRGCLLSSGIRQGSVTSAMKVSDRLHKSSSSTARRRSGDGDDGNALNALNAYEMMEKPSMNVELDGSPAIYIVLEYMDYDLNNLIRSHRKNFWMPMCMIKYIMFQMLRGLDYLDNSRVGHFDLKPNNILLDQRGHLRIGDFGLATSYDPSGKGQRSDNVFFTPATLWYRPPDLLLSNSQTGYRIAHQVDVWSAGCIFGEMMSGDPMFPGKEEWETLRRIFHVCGSPSTYEFPEAFSRDRYPGGHARMKAAYKLMSPTPNRIQQLYGGHAKRCYEREYEIKYNRSERVKLDTYDVTTTALDLLSKLLTLDPRRRLSAKEALRHPFFGEGDLDSDMLTMPQFSDLLNRVAPCDPIPDTGGVQSHRTYRENYTDPTLTICTPSMSESKTTPYTRRQPSSSVYIQRTPKHTHGPKTPQALLNRTTPLVGHIVYEDTGRRRRRGAATVHTVMESSRVGNVTRAAIAAVDRPVAPPPKRRKPSS